MQAFYHNTDDVDLDESMEHALSTLTAGDFFGEAVRLTPVVLTVQQ